jgi:hypothetical protein
MRRRNARRGPRGFVLPLAVIVLVAVSLAVALLMDGALSAFRAGSADVESARTEMTAESTLTTALGTTFDTAALATPAGTIVAWSVTTGRDSVTTAIQVVESPVVRIVVSVRHSANRIRLFAGRVAFARFVVDSARPAELGLGPIGGAWWVPFP